MTLPFYNFVDWEKNKDIVFCKNDNTTYGHLREEIEKKCTELKEIITKKDRVVVKFPNCAEAIAYFYAIDKLGGVIVPLYDLATKQEIKQVIDGVQANVFVSHEGVKKLSDEKDTIFFPKNASMIFFTSGTTGKPKRIVHTRQSILTPCYEEGKAYGITENDIFGGSPSLSFTYGFGAFAIIPLLFGASVSFFDFKVNSENPKIPINTVTCCARLFELIKEHKVTVFYSTPSIYRISFEIMFKMPQIFDLSYMRLLISAGEPMGSLLHNKLKKLIPNAMVLEHLGCTESFHALVSNTPKCVRSGSIGIKMNCFDVKIFDKTGNECPLMEKGNLAFKDLFENSKCEESVEKTNECKWKYTGDIAHKDNEGFFWFESRNDDLIKIIGLLVSPHEIEDVLMKHEAVSEIVVIGLPDLFVNQKIGAIIVLNAGFKATKELKTKLINFASKKLSLYKVPQCIIFMESIPRNNRGKIVRKHLLSFFDNTF